MCVIEEIEESAVAHCHIEQQYMQCRTVVIQITNFNCKGPLPYETTDTDMAS